MKKILLLALSLFSLCACAGEKMGPAFSEVNTLDGVALTLQQDTLKTTKATFVLTNDTDKDVTYYSAEFHMEHKKEENQADWEEFIGTAQSAWGEETAILPANSSVELPISWKVLCGPTAKGIPYRICVVVNDTPVAVVFEGK